ncbi:MAG TPA: hypothetical protein VL866_07255 [Pyrinomonadaceae bacterium]|nr:hypothetical protein [Pyrinomonadaceae bacterium]
MRVVTNSHQHFLTLLILVSCGVSSASSVHSDVRVSGTWDGNFSGIVQGRGTQQTDTFVMELEQDGSGVKGTARFKGLDLSFPVSGKVAATTFTYTAEASIGPECEFTIVGETVVDETRNRMTGSQSQTNCEGTAKGEVTAVRR